MISDEMDCDLKLTSYSGVDLTDYELFIRKEKTNDDEPDYLLCFKNYMKLKTVLAKLQFNILNGIECSYHERYKNDNFNTLFFDIDIKAGSEQYMSKFGSKSISEKIIDEFNNDCFVFVKCLCWWFKIYDYSEIAICQMSSTKKLSAHIIFTKYGCYANELLKVLDEIKKLLVPNLPFLYIFDSIDKCVLKSSGWAGLRLPLSPKKNGITKPIPFRLNAELNGFDKDSEPFDFNDLLISGVYKFNLLTPYGFEGVQPIHKAKLDMLERYSKVMDNLNYSPTIEFPSIKNDKLAKYEKKSINGELDSFGRKLEDILDIIKNTHLYEGETEIFSFRGFVNDFIIFWRRAKSYCKFCDREHESDNTLYVKIMKNKMFVGCCKKANKYDAIMIEKKDQKEQNNKEWKISDFRTTFIAGLTYEKNTMDDYPIDIGDKRLIAVKAQMGVGKSIALRRCLKSVIVKEKARVLIISFRRSFTMNQVAEYNEVCETENVKFVTYFDRSGNKKISSDHLIVQLESLRHVEFKKYNIVVIDEFQSVISQIFSTTNYKHIGENFRAFRYFLNNSDNVVIMDANLNDSHIAHFRKLLIGDFTYYSIENTYMPNKDCSLDVHGNFDEVLGLIEKSVIDGEKFVICATIGKETVVEISNVIKKHGKKCLVITSMMDLKEKDELFLKINDIIDDYDCCIYSPSLTAGVSIMSEKFTRMFIITSPRTCSSLVVSQMAGRFRKIKKFDLYCANVKFNRSVDFKKIFDKEVERLVSSIDYTYNVEKTVIDLENGKIAKEIMIDFIDLMVCEKVFDNRQKNDHREWLVNTFIARGFAVNYIRCEKNKKEFDIVQGSPMDVAFEYIKLTEKNLRDMAKKDFVKFCADVAAAKAIDYEEYIELKECGLLRKDDPTHIKCMLMIIYGEKDIAWDSVDVIKICILEHNITMFKNSSKYRELGNLKFVEYYNWSIIKCDFYKHIVSAEYRAKMRSAAFLHMKLVGMMKSGKICKKSIDAYIASEEFYTMMTNIGYKINIDSKNNSMRSISSLLYVVGYDICRASNSKKEETPYIIVDVASGIFSGENGMPKLKIGD